MTTKEKQKYLKFQFRCGNITRNPIEKAINRNIKKEVKNFQKWAYDFLTEMGYGYTPFAHNEEDGVEAILSKANKENYPKPTPKWKPEPPPPLIA